MSLSFSKDNLRLKSEGETSTIYLINRISTGLDLIPEVNSHSCGAGFNSNAQYAFKCVSLGDASAVKQSTSGLHRKQYWLGDSGCVHMLCQLRAWWPLLPWIHLEAGLQLRSTTAEQKYKWNTAWASIAQSWLHIVLSWSLIYLTFKIQSTLFWFQVLPF